MRVPLAHRIPFKFAIVFAVFVFMAQQLEGTNLYFSCLCASFICLSCIAFNVARGFLYPSGAFIFFNAMLTCIVGFTYKIFLNEPGDSNLLEPNTLMSAYCLSMIVYGLAAGVTRRFAPRSGLLSGMSTGASMKNAALGALILGAVIDVASLSGTTPGSFLAGFRQINYFVQMAILLGTFYVVKASRGKSNGNWIVWTSLAWGIILGGVLGFSKAGFLTGPVTWIAASITAGYNFPRRQVLIIVFGFAFFQQYLAPYSQVARNYREEVPTVSSNLATAIEFLGNLGQTRSTYQSVSQDVASGSSVDDGNHYYTQSQGFIERLNMMGPDDLLISYTDQGNFQGLMPTYVALLNIIPHFIWENKPVFYAGNEYARQIGIIGSDDEGTGISFSPTADAYHQVGWYGLALLGVIVFILFMVMDGLSGDIRVAPWGLLFSVLMTHTANEGLIVGQIYIFTYVALGVVVVALLSKFVLPVISGVVMKTRQTSVQHSS